MTPTSRRCSTPVRRSALWLARLDTACHRCAAHHSRTTWRIIEQSLAHLKSQGRRVIYDAEHFFDVQSRRVLCARNRQSCRRGAPRPVLCDTNGGTMPWELSEIVRTVKQAIDYRWASMS